MIVTRAVTRLAGGEKKTPEKPAKLPNARIEIFYGGTRSTRHNMITGLKDVRSNPCYLLEDYTYAVVVQLLAKKKKKRPSIAWDASTKYSDIEKLVAIEGVEEVDLAIPYNENYTPYQVTEEQLTITVRGQAISERCSSWFKQDAFQSLMWVLENEARRVCVTKWPEGKLDADALPTLHPDTEELWLCYMTQFLSLPIPKKGDPSPLDYWVERFVAKLKFVKKIILFRSGFRREDLDNLMEWLPSLTIEVWDDWLCRAEKCICDAAEGVERWIQKRDEDL
ncbi:hypothetical protein B0T17DRAFT_408928 [Bombardia bombarda]|uniref:Uncharacterized protein n=1 Tax=Bombardia bombarda TaxID=252184 RepID=A0AA39TU21_9PEZI|nr:hypothetical protein B0T17DRAFT_408928 [Bombardia bombarda]